MVELFQSSKQNISLHINNIFNEGELDRLAIVKESLTVQNEEKRSVKRKVEQYSLDVIISIGYRVKSIRGTQLAGIEVEKIKMDCPTHTHYKLKLLIINRNEEEIAFQIPLPHRKKHFNRLLFTLL